MSIALPVHLPGPTFTPGSTIAGRLVSKDAVHLLHNNHRRLGLYETDNTGTVRKVQEFLMKGTTSIHLIAARDKASLDAFVLVGDLVDWYSIQKKGTDAIHDFVRLNSQEQLMQFCRTVPYTFVRLDAESQELVEMRRFYFAEDRSPAILTHELDDGTDICIVGTSTGLIGVLSTTSNAYDSYYKVRGSQSSTYRYASLSRERIVVQAVFNNECCFFFLRLDPSGGVLSLTGTYVPKHTPQSMPLGIGAVPSQGTGIACIWYANKIEFVDPDCDGQPKLLHTLQLPLTIKSVRHTPQLSEPGVETFLTSSHLARLTGVAQLQIVDAPAIEAEIGGGSLYSHKNDLVQLRKYTDSSSVGWMVRENGSLRREFPFAYELATISSRGCEPTKKEFSSWSHYFDPHLGSSFLTTKDTATYAVCRKSGRCADRIEDVIQLWQYDSDIIASTETETMAFRFVGTPRLDLKPRPLFKCMEPARTFAFKDGTQVTGTHVNFIDSDQCFAIPARCMPVVDATCVNRTKVVLASDFNTFAISNGQIVEEKSFDEPVMKVIAANGIVATMTPGQLHVEHKFHTQVLKFDDRISDVVVTNGHVVSCTFDGSVYLGSQRLSKVNVDCRPVKLIVAGHKVLAVSEIDAVVIDTHSLSAHSALALSGVQGGFAWDENSFAVLKNGNMWVCDLNAIGISLQRTSQILIGPIKADATSSAPQWTWTEKLACSNAINSVRFGHEVTDVCPVHPLQLEYLRDFDGLISAIEPKAYISSFETLYLWADFTDFDLFKRLTTIQKRLETRMHTFGGHESPKWLEWRGFVDGELLNVALQNPNVDWLFKEEGVDAEALRSTFRQVSY